MLSVRRRQANVPDDDDDDIVDAAFSDNDVPPASDAATCIERPLRSVYAKPDAFDDRVGFAFNTL